MATLLNANQILPGSADFELFQKDSDGNIPISAPLVLDGVKLATLNDVGGDAVNYSMSSEKFSGNGFAKDFDLENTPIGNPMVFKNGVRQLKDDDYTFSDKKISFTEAPSSTDTIIADFLVIE